MYKPEKMIIYNLFPLLAGTFSDWEKHLVRAKNMGFNWVFVNPIQCPGSSGSLYSIADYFNFNSLLVDRACGRSPFEQVRDIINVAEKLGLSLMVDLVINHCSFDSLLIKKNPAWFEHEPDGSVSHPFCMENGKKVIWGDLARFDHRNTKDKEGLFNYCIKIITFLINAGFKGFRCDAAYMVPSSLWKRIIQDIKKEYPAVCFFAETLGCPPDLTRKVAEAGFDYIFNSSKWWDFNGHWLMEQYNLTRDMAPSVSFPESHDTLRLCEESQGRVDALKQRYLFAAFFSGAVMMPIGFEFGFRKKLHVVETRPDDWEQTDIDLTPFITRVNRVKADYTVFQEDAPTQILAHSNPHLLLMWKGSLSSRTESLLILNKDIFRKQLFYAESLKDFVQAGAQLVDVSPDNPLAYIPEPFSYELLPGQAIMLVTTRDPVPEE
ncbi:MAG: alpha-amylase family glycosyl hydrolase [Pseudomonadota bacterium]